MGPINYLAMLPQQDFLRDIQGGFQLGAGIRQVQEQRAEKERALALQQQYQADIATAMKSPNPQAFAALALKYPQHREAFKQGWDTLNADQQQNELRDATTLAAALQSGRPDVALQRVEERIEAMKASGQQAPELEFIRDRIKTDPQGAYGSVLQVLSALPGSDKVLENLGRVGAEGRAQDLHGSAVTKAAGDARRATADATTAEVKAKFAPSQATMELEKAGWDITKIQSDIAIAKENARINAINAAAARETNALKAEELRMKANEAIEKRDAKIREKVGEAESGANAIDNMLNTIARIEQNGSLNDVVGSIEGRLPVILSDEGADAVALIDTLGSQAFLAQIPNIKGMGALSNAEGEKLQSALQNLSRKQSEKQFRANLAEATRLLKKGRENLARSTGVPLAPPDTPAAPRQRGATASAPGGATGSWDAAPVTPTGGQRTVTVDF